MAGLDASLSSSYSIDLERSLVPVISNLCLLKWADRASKRSVSSLLPPYAVEAIRMSAPPEKIRVIQKEQIAGRHAVKQTGLFAGLTSTPEIV